MVRTPVSALRQLSTLILLLGTSCSGGSDHEDQSYLFVSNSKSATLATSSADDGALTLSMIETVGEVVYFPDRGTDDAEVGRLSQDSFVRFWNQPSNPNSFANFPPNAVLEGYDSEGVLQSIGLTLYNPQWNAENATQSFRATLLTEAPSAGASNLVLPLHLTDTALFIDDETGAVAPSSTPAPAAAGHPLDVSYESNMYFIASDHGSGAPHSVEVYRPIPAAGSYFLSDFVQGSMARWSWYGALVVRPNANDDPNNPALMAPTGATLIWDDRHSGGKHNWQIFMPTAPEGYVCMGMIAQGDYGPVKLPAAYRCVRRDLVTTDKENFAGNEWTDQGSGAKKSVQIHGPDAILGDPKTYYIQTLSVAAPLDQDEVTSFGLLKK